ncbi:hypothetical protein EJB05_15982, partial [Eragrostis curvula]
MDVLLMDRQIIVAVDRYGGLFRWNIEAPHVIANKMAGPVHVGNNNIINPRAAFYLAQRNGRLVIVCVHGEDKDAYSGSRVTLNHQCDFIWVDRVEAKIYDPDLDVWLTEESIFENGESLFLGLNYAFFFKVPPTFQKIRGDHIYLADFNNNDTIGIDIKTGASHFIEFPIVDFNVRQPIWFRPTTDCNALEFAKLHHITA